MFEERCRFPSGVPAPASAIDTPPRPTSNTPRRNGPRQPPRGEVRGGHGTGDRPFEVWGGAHNPPHAPPPAPNGGNQRTRARARAERELGRGGALLPEGRAGTPLGNRQRSSNML